MSIDIFINYVSEHQLSHAVNASYTMPTTDTNCGSILLKLISGDIVHVLYGFCTYPKPRPNHLSLNQVLLLGSQ